MLRAGVLACLLALAPSAEAQVGVSFNRTGSGARAAGMANAFIAISDDGTAASWNPSGLAQLRKPELSVVSTTEGDSSTATGFRARDDSAAYTTAQSTDRNSYLDFASLAVPVTLWGKPVTFQGSWRRLYSLDYRELFTIDARPARSRRRRLAARLDGNGDTLGAVDLVSVALAVSLTRRLSLGAGLNFWRGDWRGGHRRERDAARPSGRAALRDHRPDEPRARRELQPGADARLPSLERGTRLPGPAPLGLQRHVSERGERHGGAPSTSPPKAPSSSPAPSAWARPFAPRRSGPWRST